MHIKEGVEPRASISAGGSIRRLMKTVKTKLHHHRKSKAISHPAMSGAKDASEFWNVDHDLPDPDLQLYRIERSPKQENL